MGRVRRRRMLARRRDVGGRRAREGRRALSPARSGSQMTAEGLAGLEVRRFPGRLGAPPIRRIDFGGQGPPSDRSPRRAGMCSGSARGAICCRDCGLGGGGVPLSDRALRRQGAGSVVASCRGRSARPLVEGHEGGHRCEDSSRPGRITPSTTVARRSSVAPGRPCSRPTPMGPVDHRAPGRQGEVTCRARTWSGPHPPTGATKRPRPRCQVHG